MLIMGESCDPLIGGTCKTDTELNPIASGTKTKQGRSTTEPKYQGKKSTSTSWNVLQCISWGSILLQIFCLTLGDKNVDMLPHQHATGIKVE